MKPNPRILISDDSENLRKVIRRYLSSKFKDAVFFEAGDGEEAELHLQEQSIMGEPIDVVFLDWMMPGVTGFEFMVKIRGTELFKSKPKIIMLTAETYSEQMNAAHKFDVTAYIIKPFEQHQLIEALEKALAALESEAPESGGLKNAS